MQMNGKVGTCVNRSLSSSHRHVGCVCYQRRSFHDALNFAINFHGELLGGSNITQSEELLNCFYWSFLRLPSPTLVSPDKNRT